MPNTGRVLTTTLTEHSLPCPTPCTPTGNTKANQVDDPNYIGPEFDPSLCAITPTLTCPTFLATNNAGDIFFEFSILNSVANNPAIASIKIRFSVGGVPRPETIDLPLPLTPSPTYHSENFAIDPGNTYDMHLDYLDSGNVVLASCNDIASVTIP